MPASSPVPPPRLVLASTSPRRQALLSEAGYTFLVVPSRVDETDVPGGLLPSAVAERLALAKARAVATDYPDDVVLGADTVVAFGDQLLGKPAGADDARDMLSLLEGTTHIVITGVAVVHLAQGRQLSRRAMSAVRMKRMSPAQIDAYVVTGDWQGKAGGYGIQDPDPFVARTAGSHSNIVGLPMTVTRELLRQAGIRPEVLPRRHGGTEE